MFSLSICFGPSGTTWALLFKTKEAAQAAQNKLIGGAESVEDDYGQDFIAVSPIHAVLFEDMNLSKLAHHERAMHEARIRTGVQQAAQTDPQLRHAQRANGPAIMTPFGGAAR